MAETEDISYSAPEFATPEDEKKPDEDQPYKGVLIEVQKYLDGAIAKHNSLDVLNPEAENTMSTQQQVVVHMAVVAHLKKVKVDVDNKIKELL